MMNNDPSKPAATPPVQSTGKKDRPKKRVTGRHDAITHLLSTVSLNRDGKNLGAGKDGLK